MAQTLGSLERSQRERSVNLRRQLSHADLTLTPYPLSSSSLPGPVRLPAVEKVQRSAIDHSGRGDLNMKVSTTENNVPVNRDVKSAGDSTAAMNIQIVYTPPQEIRDFG